MTFFLSNVIKQEAFIEKKTELTSLNNNSPQFSVKYFLNSSSVVVYGTPRTIKSSSISGLRDLELWCESSLMVVFLFKESKDIADI